MPFISDTQMRKTRARQKMLAQEVLMYQRVMEELRKNFKFDSLLQAKHRGRNRGGSLQVVSK